MPDSPSSTKLGALARLVPGATEQPRELARRRLFTGLTIVFVSIMLQTVPTAIRAQAVGPAAGRFVYWLFEMAVLTISLSSAYDYNQRRRSSTAVTLTSTVTVALFISVISTAFYNLFLLPSFPWLRGDSPPRTLAFSLAFGFVIGMLHTGVWALAFVYPYSAEDARSRALEADKLRLEADQLRIAAELARLRSQLEPHFLLNTLNAIAGLVTDNPREARRLIACLGDLLRDSLRDADELQPLEDEVAWLRRYAEILESRHAGTLSFHWEIAPDVARTLIPRLLLQPLVENAVKHGALKRREGGLVTVRATSSDEAGSRRLVCTVEDNGPGLPDGEPRRGAFGLRSVRRRLELKYPSAVLRMESSELGTRSIVELPTLAHKPTREAQGSRAEGSS